MSEKTAAPAAIPIPFQKQLDLEGSRTCGAACLSMVYEALGKKVPQDEIWPKIAKSNNLGRLASTTYLMAQDACLRGFAALAIQAKYPLHSLRALQEQGVLVIINHRLRKDDPAGHYSVVAKIDSEKVVLHDPLLGPDQVYVPAELFDLWQPAMGANEIVGGMLIGIAADPPIAQDCRFCHTPFPLGVRCPRCGKPVPLRPQSVLGCLNDQCIARAWNAICCPSCDHMWGFSANPPGEKKETPDFQATQSFSLKDLNLGPADPDPLHLGPVTAGMDRIFQFINAMPTVAAHPLVKQQLELIAAQRLDLQKAAQDEIARRNAAREERKRAEAEKKAKEKAAGGPAAPADPKARLDAEELGRALLENLGFR